MDFVLGDPKDVFAMTYMNDVVVFFHWYEDYLKHLCTTLERMRDRFIL